MDYTNRKQFHDAADTIGRQFKLKRVIGMIVANDMLKLHTQCILCNNIRDYEFTAFVRDPEYQQKCAQCGASLSYQSDPTPIKPTVIEKVKEPTPEPVPKPIAEPAPIASAPVDPELKETVEEVITPVFKLETIQPERPVEILPKAILNEHRVRQGDMFGPRGKKKKKGKKHRFEQVTTESPVEESKEIPDTGRTYAYAELPEDVKYIGDIARFDPKKSLLDRVQEYSALVGESINGRVIKRLWINGKKGNAIMCVLECPKCGVAVDENMSNVVNTPEIINGCRCYFSKHDVDQPKQGDVSGTWIVDRFYKKAYSSSGYNRRSWMVDCHCKECGDIASLTIQDWHSQVECKRCNSKSSKPPLRKMKDTPMIDSPIIRVCKDGRQIINAGECGQLYGVYHNMIRTAQRTGVDVAIEWFDDESRILNNVEGFKRFWKWSMANGYTSTKSVSGINLVRLLRKNLDGDFTPSNCYWSVIGSC